MFTLNEEYKEEWAQYNSRPKTKEFGSRHHEEYLIRVGTFIEKDINSGLLPEKVFERFHLETSASLHEYKFFIWDFSRFWIHGDKLREWHEQNNIPPFDGINNYEKIQPC